MSEERKNDITKDRPKRVPLHEQGRSVLTAPEKKGFVRRIVNDVGPRIAKFIKAGWNVVEEDINLGESVDGSNQAIGSGARKGVGKGVTGVLMEIPKELYDADQRAKQARITKDENALKRKIKSNDSGEDGVYGDVGITSTK